MYLLSNSIFIDFFASLHRPIKTHYTALSTLYKCLLWKCSYSFQQLPCHVTNKTYPASFILHQYWYHYTGHIGNTKVVIAKHVFTVSWSTICVFVCFQENYEEERKAKYSYEIEEAVKCDRKGVLCVFWYNSAVVWTHWVTWHGSYWGKKSHWFIKIVLQNK